MSFPKTKTHTKSDIKKKPKYPVPMRKVENNRAKPMVYYLTPELEAEFRRLFPIKTNLQIMELFGIGFSTMQRFKRSLGLKKDMKKIRSIQTQMTKRICEANGYYDSLRGKKPSEAFIEGARRYIREHGHPMKALQQTNPRRYKAVRKKILAARRVTERKERLRVDYGLEQHTKLHRPYSIFSRQQISYRTRLKKIGYILGDMRDKFHERYVIYFDAETERNTNIEAGAQRCGFEFKRLPEEDAV